MLKRKKMVKKKKSKSFSTEKLLIVGLLVLSFSFFVLYGFLPQLSVTGLATTATQVGNLTVGVQTFIACTWANNDFNISFGDNINPGTNDYNASHNFDYPNTSLGSAQDLNNGTSYNISIDSTTNVQTNVTIKGLHFLSGANIIGIGNVTWAGNTTRANGTNMLPSTSNILSLSYNATVPVGSLLNAGGTAWFRFWLDVPAGATAGQYSGNFTQQCSQGV